MFLIINIMYLVCDIVTFLYASLRYCKPSFGKVKDVKINFLIKTIIPRLLVSSKCKK